LAFFKEPDSNWDFIWRAEVNNILKENVDFRKYAARSKKNVSEIYEDEITTTTPTSNDSPAVIMTIKMPNILLLPKARFLRDLINFPIQTTGCMVAGGSPIKMSIIIASASTSSPGENTIVSIFITEVL